MKIPEVRTDENDECGPASVASVLQYWNIPATVSQLRLDLNTDPDAGTNPYTIEGYFRARRNLNVLCGNMELIDLAFHLFQGRPVITVMGGHYVVVHDMTEDYIRFLCPQEGFMAKERTNFVKWWSERDTRYGEVYSQVGIVAFPRGNNVRHPEATWPRS